jgi:hypothetical protein
MQRSRSKIIRAVKGLLQRSELDPMSLSNITYAYHERGPVPEVDDLNKVASDVENLVANFQLS